MTRKSRNRSLPPNAFLVPISIHDFGDFDKDPCFGKHYDLIAPECQACGDLEFCAVVTAQLQKKTRLLQEKSGNNLDKTFSDLELVRDIKEFVKVKEQEGFSSLKARKKASIRFNKSIIQNGHEQKTT